jgi:outer membrane protein assembly factor BamB
VRRERRILPVLVLLTVAAARAQGPPAFHPSFAPATEPDLAIKLKGARTFIKAQEWPEAVGVLQSVLEAGEDALVPAPRKDRDDRETLAWVSARVEALRLLDALPPQAREFLEATHGPRATALLNRARMQNDPELLAEAVRLFLPTRSGLEAARLLGVHHLDRGRPGLAARCFRLALERGAAKSWDASQLVLAALAFHRCGDTANVERTWKLLEASGGGVKLGGRVLAPAELKKRLTAPPGEGPPVGDWNLFRGDERRGGRGQGEIASLKSLWTMPTSEVPDGWLGSVLRRVEEEGQPILPAVFPLAGGGRAVFRTARGLAGVDLDSGKLLWESVSGLGLEALAEDAAAFSHVNGWVQSYLRKAPQVLLENSVLGTLSAAGGHVYAVDDLPLPPWPESYLGFRSTVGTGFRLNFAPDLTAGVFHSRLLALEASTGKLAWEVGGRGAGPLEDAYFLGPPLPLAGRLYALAEKDQELKLVCLAQRDGKLLWQQKLGLPKNKLLFDGGRRIHAALLLHVDGVLVCPTNAGAVLSFDLVGRSLLWAESYHKPIPPPPPAPPVPPGRVRGIRRLAPLGAQEPPNLKSFWKTPAALVSGDRLLLTAPDEEDVVCLALRDGAPLWRAAENEDDLYLAATDGRVALIVGRTHCRALKLDDGKEAWRVETGSPSGQGVLAGATYYLPLRSDPTTRQPSVLALDLLKGAVRGRVATPGGAVLGNLIVHGNRVLSQTATGVQAYSRSNR